MCARDPRCDCLPNKHSRRRRAPFHGVARGLMRNPTSAASREALRDHAVFLGATCMSVTMAAAWRGKIQKTRSRPLQHHWAAPKNRPSSSLHSPGLVKVMTWVTTQETPLPIVKAEDPAHARARRCSEASQLCKARQPQSWNIRKGRLGWTWRQSPCGQRSNPALEAELSTNLLNERLATTPTIWHNRVPSRSDRRHMLFERGA
mmetsp:Transcript_48629/g.141719  ORF Transcript_48629/g.141719 Transcript_48629/m.141719 type:complete len:204 (+) Transcript_48629:948-1559(+)